ncbi:O-antigen ligase family protein [Oxalobacteraceae bacterium R-40]|uniref:O-antigen ligase family protein n=1 Tax=Keguizhuia sedimenti TaxID=3064264 RepID=A0ABU1BQW2_9BURK|nr:O-antigen ligase family protein [Oxalobacteraceae bacterium R-40]
MLGLIAIILRYRNPSYYKALDHIWVSYYPLSLSMASMMIAVLIQQLATGTFESKPYDVPFHVASFGIFFWLFLQLRSKDLKVIQWGAIAGVLASMMVIYAETRGGIDRPAKILDVAIIPFSNHATLLAFLVFLSIKWDETQSKALIGLKALTLCAGLYITFLSQTRGGWPALLLYAIIASAIFLGKDWKKTTLAMTAFLTLLVSTAMLSENIHKRIETVKTDISSYMDGTNPDTSVGMRLQYWDSSWILIKKNWGVGIGADTYKDEIKKLAQQNIVTEQAASLPHPHNELLFQTVRYGIPGLVSILLVLFMPLVYFGRFIRHPDQQIRASAWMGGAVCLAFFSFGLTDVVLVWRHTTTFYAFLLAVCFAHIVNRMQELENGKPGSIAPESHAKMLDKCISRNPKCPSL